MKILIKILSALILMASLSAQANTMDMPVEDGDLEIEAFIDDFDTPVAMHKKAKKKKGKKGKRRGCRKAKLSKDQKKMMRSARKEFRKFAVPKRKELRKARKARRKLHMDENSTLEQAMEATDKVIGLRTELMTARAQLRNEILYTIANFDQRKELKRCMLKRRIKRMKKRIKRMKRRLKKGDQGHHHGQM